MENIQQVKYLYDDYQSSKLFFKDTQKQEMKTNIHLLINMAITTLHPSLLFTNIWMLEILEAAFRRSGESLDVLAVARAFKSLEKYILHLVQQPWKREFQEIKMYGGFYKTRIKSVIPDCEYIFTKVGYIIIPESNTMVYKGHNNKDYLLLLSFECRVCQLECKAIAEKLIKAKDLPITLQDIISNVFKSRYRVNNPQHWQNAPLRYSPSTDIVMNMNVSSPPAIPKRQPVIESAILKPNVVLENIHKIKSSLQKVDPQKSDRDMKDKLKVSLPKLLHLSPDLNSLYSSNTALSSDVKSESVAYIDKVTGEHIPELLQGTVEDHINETLKLVNRYDHSTKLATEDIKQKRKSITSLDKSNYLPISPLISRRTSSGPVLVNSIQSFIDEGIEQDISTSKSFSYSSKYGPAGAQQILPSRNAFSSNQTDYDPGYITRNPTNNYSQFSSTYNVPSTIYHPPSTHSISSGKIVLSRQNASLYPLAPRTLASLNSDKESVDSSIYSPSAIPFTTSHPVSIGLRSLGKTSLVQPSKSVPGYLPHPKQSMEEEILKKRPAVYKTNSLKTDLSRFEPIDMVTTKMSNNLEINNLWQCPTCSQLNVHADTICSACSHIYIDANVNLSESNNKQALF